MLLYFIQDKIEDKE